MNNVKVDDELAHELAELAHARAVMGDEGFPVSDPEPSSSGTIGYAYGLAMGALDVTVTPGGSAELHPDGSVRKELGFFRRLFGS